MSDDHNDETGFTPLTDRMWRGGDRFSSMGQIHDLDLADELHISSGNSPHAYSEQTIMPDGVSELIDFVDWKYWAAKLLWTAEQGFTLCSRLDPKEFAAIQVIPGRSQKAGLYPFAATHAHELQQVTYLAMLNGDLIFTAPTNFNELSPQELFKKATLDPKYFLRWADGLEGCSIPPELRHLLTTVEASASVEQLTPQETHIFRKEKGNIWTIRMDGEKLRLKELAGFIYIREALRNPQKSMSFFDLFKALEIVDNGMLIDKDVHTTPDEKARQEYKQRLETLEGERKKCLIGEDEAGAERVEAQIDIFNIELTSKYSKKGGKNKRINAKVRKNIADAIQRIENTNAAMGHHFLEKLEMKNLALNYNAELVWKTS